MTQQGAVPPQLEFNAANKARRGPIGTPPAVAQAEREHEACVYKNLAAYQLYQASESVVIGVNRRDELRKTGERLEWKLATRENFQEAERDLATHWRWACTIFLLPRHDTERR